jgi:hypothetical protein
MQGMITSVSDQEIRWSYNSVSAVPGFTPSTGNSIFVLDRYSGIMTEEIGSNQGSVEFGPGQCRKMQKAF